MTNYLDNLNDEVREYFKILCPKFPEWLLEYINTFEMERISKISMSCGTDYSPFFNVKYFYSNLDHSVGVALIIWHFTKSKEQTLAGLFHDIATPVFKHCIDFMNNDSENQESTEEKTREMIENSHDIMKLLERDGISVDRVCDYKIYPLADNDTPRLSADRFEYTFSSGLTFNPIWDLESIKEVYENIIIVKNEDGLDEFAFNDLEICKKYMEIISKLWPSWIASEDRIVMQFLADITKSMINKGYLTIEDLYTLSEADVINKIRACPSRNIRNAFFNFENTDKAYTTTLPVKDRYCINVNPKRRYIIPLVKIGDSVVRITEVDEKSKEIVEEYFNIDTNNYVFFDFDFKPVEKSKVLVKK